MVADTGREPRTGRPTSRLPTGATMSTSPVHHTTTPRVRARPGTASRRFGYVVGAAGNALLLYLVNRNPGWQAVPFLTPETTEVLGLVNASIAASLVANVVYVAWDPLWLKALGDLVTTSVAVLASVRIWQVWPLDLAAGSAWEVVARLVCGLAVVGGLIGIIASLVRFGRALAAPNRPE
jgi:hypothetical protein